MPGTNRQSERRLDACDREFDKLYARRDQLLAMLQKLEARRRDALHGHPPPGRR
jgi:hypothetical protein